MTFNAPSRRDVLAATGAALIALAVRPTLPPLQTSARSTDKLVAAE